MIAILAMGNELRGDDGVGIYAGNLLKNRGFDVIFAYESPENVLGVLRRFKKIFILDAAHFKENAPFLTISKEKNTSFYTHKLDIEKFKKFTNADIRLIGIKTYNRELGEPISTQAKVNAREAIKVIEVCMAIPGKVIDVNEKIVELHGKKKKVKFGLPGIKEGDFVLIHAGVVIEKMSEEEFKTISEEMKEFIL